MLIEVTKEDIYFGEAGEPTSCPIARAVKRAYETVERSPFVSVSDDEIVIDEIRTATPWEAVNFIESFDDCDYVEPFSFEINPKMPEVASNA